MAFRVPFVPRTVRTKSGKICQQGPPPNWNFERLELDFARFQFTKWVSERPPPQVMRDVVTDVNMAKDVGDSHAEHAASKAWAELLHEFLHGQGQAKHTQKHRHKVFAWLRASHNALRMVVPGGWSKFKVDDATTLRSAASLTLCVDQGSDGWSAGHFLLDRQYNVTLIGDLSHRLWE